ncbi:hypothetical protein SOVF_108220, partial [Spinacia oleracea]
MDSTGMESIGTSSTEIGEGSRVPDGDEKKFMFRYSPASSFEEEEEVGDDFSTPKRRIVRTAFGEENEVPQMKIGMVFPDWEEIEDQFEAYGRQKGFAVVRRSGAYKSYSSQSKDGGKEKVKQKRNALWTCECFGHPERKSKEK